MRCEDEATGISPDEFRKMQSLTADLAGKIKHMERRGASLAIKVGRHMFASIEDVQQFVRLHMKGCYNVGVLSDFVSLLCRISVKNRATEDSAVARAVQGAKISLDPVEAAVLNSFSHVIPSCLSSTGSTMTSGTKPLPGIPSRESWSDPVAGRQVEIEREIHNERRVIEDRIAFLDDHAPEGAQLCRLLLAKSTNHWIAYSQFLDSFYQMTHLSWNIGATEAHYLTTGMGRQTFVSLRRHRVGGQDLVNSGTKELVFVRTLWAMLQAHAMMDEFVTKKFSGHHEMTDVVYSFVLGNRVSSIDIKKAQEAAAQAQVLVQYVEKDVARLLQKADLNPIARPNKKKNGSG